MMKIAIAGATGQIGSRVASRIAASGNIPITIGTNRSRLEKLGIKAAISRTADLCSVKEVVEATKDAYALFWLVPPVLHVNNLKEWYQKVTAAGIAAVKENGIKKVVLISSLGVDRKDEWGTLAYCAEMEIAFDALNADILALRPGYFMENILMQADRIKEQGEFWFPFEENFSIPMISTDDIGEVAAKYLLNNAWSGHWKLNLMGTENLSGIEMARQLSNLTHERLSYKQSSITDNKSLLASFGANATVQQELTDMFVALASLSGPYATPRTPEAYTGTSFTEFATIKLLHRL